MRVKQEQQGTQDLTSSVTGQLLLRDAASPPGPVRCVMVLGLIAVPQGAVIGDDVMYDLSGTRQKEDLRLEFTPREPASFALARRQAQDCAELVIPEVPRAGVSGEVLLRLTTSQAPDGRPVVMVAGKLWTARRSPVGGDMMHGAFGGDRMGTLIMATQPVGRIEERYLAYRADQLLTAPLWRV